MISVKWLLDWTKVAILQRQTFTAAGRESQRIILAEQGNSSKSKTYATLMKLHLASDGNKNRFTGYGDGYVAINNQHYSESVVVTPEAIDVAWRVANFDSLNVDHMQHLIALKAEIVILGTGATQRFPAPALLRNFAAAQIGLEVMATPAACRTYNILLAEGRAVMAAVLVT